MDVPLVDFRTGAYRRLNWKRHEQEAGEEQAVKRSDGGGLGEFAQAGGFLAAADALLMRQRGKEVLEEGNNAFDHAPQKSGSGVTRHRKQNRFCFVLLHEFVGAILDQSVGIVKRFPKKQCLLHDELRI